MNNGNLEVCEHLARLSGTDRRMHVFVSDKQASGHACFRLIS